MFPMTVGAKLCFTSSSVIDLKLSSTHIKRQIIDSMWPLVSTLTSEVVRPKLLCKNDLQ
jgi:hypothetical protein